MMTYYLSPRSRRLRTSRRFDTSHTEVYIPFDVVADDDGYQISAFIPGVDVEDVKIEVLDDTVSISGEFTSVEDDDTRYLLRERPSGRFSRVLRLPTALEAGEAEADISNGVLTLLVPQAESAKPKKITIKAK